MRHVNNLGPSKFRTGAENSKEEICYYNCNKTGGAFNSFLAVRNQTSTKEIISSIANLIDISNKFKNSYYKVDDVLTEFDNGRVQPEYRIRKFYQSNTKIPRTPETGGGNNNATQRKQRRIIKKPRFLIR